MLVLGLMISVSFWMGQKAVTLAATATVQASSGWVRESADKNSKALGSVEKGASLEILEEKTDSEGYTWYKVPVEGNVKGYIRADLVSVTGSIPSSGSDATQQQSGNSGAAGQSSESQGDATISETDIVGVKTISQSRIRKGPGVNYDSAGGVNGGTDLVVTGIATGSDGQNWYKVNLADNSLDGFIREDLVEVTERAEIPETAPEETAPESETPEAEAGVEENHDFHLKYMANENGEVDWYLFNNIEGTSMSLTQMLDVIEQVRNKQLKDEADAGTMKLVIIVMGVVIGFLIVIVTLLGFKLKDAHSYIEYEDDDEAEEEPEEESEVQEVEEEAEEEEVIQNVQKPSRSFFAKKSSKNGRESLLAQDDEETEEIKETKGSNPSKKSDNKAWQSKDFLELDDDMEFEFLDL